MKNYYDNIIVGTGIAGLYTAINIKNSRTLLVSKSQLKSGSTPLAQGGIVSCRYIEEHFKDTIAAGANYNKAEAVRVIEEESKYNIEKLISLGVNFDRDDLGNLKYTREGGHSKNTILYSKDRTGSEIVETLIREVKKSKNIDIAEDTMVINIEEDIYRGEKKVYLLNDNKKYCINVQNIVFATGGVGELYLNTTNTAEATGDGIAIAKRMGVDLKDMEFIQFHPTSIASTSEKKRFLISESLRGEGAKLVNNLGESFMNNLHSMGELAPRDIVSRGIYKEIVEGRRVYLDIRHESREFLSERFPTIYKRCLEEGIDISSEKIEVAPAEHYIMGGIETDLYGRTNISGVYACGECACTGVHGGNRLASNSLLEGIVFGNRIAKILDSKEYIRQNNKIYKVDPIAYVKTNNLKIAYYDNIRLKLKKIMEYNLGIIRYRESIDMAIEKIESIKVDLIDKKSSTSEFYELYNMILVAEEIAHSAKDRDSSLGAHYLEDIRRNKNAR